jgi:hypothetical protein
MKKTPGKKTRPERERELIAMLITKEGPDEILALYRKAIGMPPGESPPKGTLMRRTMIPAILLSEYPRRR